MSTKLFVGGIAWATTEDTLKGHFSQAGNVISANIITNKYTGRSRGFGFVEMGSEDEANAAIEKLNGQPLDGRPLVVNFAKPQVDRDGGQGSSQNEEAPKDMDTEKKPVRRTRKTAK